MCSSMSHRKLRMVWVHVSFLQICLGLEVDDVGDFMYVVRIDVGEQYEAPEQDLVVVVNDVAQPLLQFQDVPPVEVVVQEHV